ncbi:MAG TPA: M50 family metallopeptidase [Solirubrobacteraceae bacterium]|jgi:regulator of sigma E protease|nr:M50 family metallopeptidase [Solirubrobacteraceae bacterium]
MTFLVAIAGIAALIILHEFGHFVVAKAVGMRVERFSLFFGPMLVKFRRGETEYGIGPIPLGGYVKITGMNPNEDIPLEVVPRAYYRQPVWKRVVVILAGPAMNLLVAFIILTALVLSQGVLVTSHGQPVLLRTVAKGSLVAPASNYLKAGDEIVSVDGKRGLSVAQIAKQISSHHCAGTPTNGCQATTPVTIVIRRHGSLERFTILPRYDAGLKKTRIGFAFSEAIHHYGVLGAAGQGASQMWYVTHETVSRVVQIFRPQDRKQLHGIVGVTDLAQQAVALGPAAALDILALISLSLAIINLFPFLPLDGGHVFWAVAEKVRGRPIPFAVMERAGVVGFVLVVLIGFIGLSNDISSLSGSGLNLR